MAEVTNEEEMGSGSSSEEESSDQQQQCLSSESLAEWRSSEQLENGIPSTSPPYWDSDDEDDGGPKPVELYGKYTWKIDKFSQINKRELRSNPFEVGGYKWYILIYPQGCDVCNHLSLFLCVANHDKLLPGWSHFAQFTIAVVNKDPKKSKYSDTLHRFWKKEHDWGWKKFMELSKVLDGFIDSDTLIIKAQVQVIRERADRPFRCLDCQYRRELIRVYLTNVEQICRRFVEERRNKLGKLIDDKARWSSFSAFWQSMDSASRCLMTQEKTVSILKVVVKHFFIEKEVTSTLVMDSLHSGLKALESPYKGKKMKGKCLESEDMSAPIIRKEKDMFVLDDDVLLLLERAAKEPLPPKDEKGPQNRLKDGAVGEESSRDCIERDERRLTELGRWTIEIFILAHIFSKIEVAYQEAVALKKQEELIREEEAAWLAETKRDKEKKSKKKQGKQKRNNRKGKEKVRDEKPSCIIQVEMEQSSFTAKTEDLIAPNEVMALEKSVAPEDVSDVSDSVDCAPERLLPDSEDREVSPVNWDTDASEARPPTEASSSGVCGLSSMQNGTEGKSPCVDDSSSTSSSDSVPSLPQKSNPQHHKSKRSSRRRGRNHQAKLTIDSNGLVDEESNHSEAVAHDKPLKGSGIAPSVAPKHHRTEEGASCIQRTVCGKDAKIETPEDTNAAPAQPSKEIPSAATEKLVLKVDVASSNPLLRKKLSSDSPKKSVSPAKPVEYVHSSKTSAQKPATPKATEKTSRDAVHLRIEKLSMDSAPATTDKLAVPPAPVLSRPYSAPTVLSPGVVVSTHPMASTSPALGRSRSVSVASNLGPDSSAAQSYIPLSYRNAITGGPVMGSPRSFPHNRSSVPSSSVPYSQAAPPVSSPMVPQSGSDRMDMNQMKTALPFGMLNHDSLAKSRSLWQASSQRNIPGEVASRLTEMQPPGISSPSAMQAVFGWQTHVSPDEFPHLDIINDLLDDESGFIDTSRYQTDYQSFRNGQIRPHLASHPYGFPGDSTALPSSSGGPLSGLCRFERRGSFSDDRYQYSIPMGSSTEALRDMNPHRSSHPYSNGQVAGLFPSHPQVAGHERPYLIPGSSDNDGYLYRLREYQNMSIGSTGFPVYRPSNGL